MRIFPCPNNINLDSVQIGQAPHFPLLFDKPRSLGFVRDCASEAIMCPTSAEADFPRNLAFFKPRLRILYCRTLTLICSRRATSVGLPPVSAKVQGPILATEP